MAAGLLCSVFSYQIMCRWVGSMPPALWAHSKAKVLHPPPAPSPSVTAWAAFDVRSQFDAGAFFLASRLQAEDPISSRLRN
jgi:hypothetical protein